MGIIRIFTARWLQVTQIGDTNDRLGGRFSVQAGQIVQLILDRDGGRALVHGNEA